MNKYQQHYNTLIRQANLAYVQSEEEMFAALHTILLAKAEAFEDAASLFAHHFTEVIPTETMRFNSIREHHLEDEASQERDEPRNQVETDL